MFNVDNHRASGRSAHCRSCRSIAAKDRRIAHGPKLRAQNAAWRAANSDQVRQKDRTRRLNSRAICLVAAARVRASKRNILFTLTADDIAYFQAVIDAGKCQLSGVAFDLSGSRDAFSPSLDRIKPNDGYTRENVRVICRAMNAALGNWGESDLKEIVQCWLNP